MVEKPVTQDEAVIAAILTAGSAQGMSALYTVARYRDILEELRRVGGHLNPKKEAPVQAVQFDR